MTSLPYPKNFDLHSGERVIVTTQDLIPPDHWLRYRYAAQFLREAIPAARFGADVFCGVGYGTDILAQAFPQATMLGIDGSAESIARAAEAFPRGNIHFSAKLFPFTLPEETLDFICSFESIEHVLDDGLFARTLTNALKPGGFLFVSSPNLDRVDLVQTPYHWHYRHLSPEALRDTFMPLGLKMVSWGSTQCLVFNDEGTLHHGYCFTLPRRELAEVGEFDTVMCVFRKMGSPAS